MVLYLLVVGIHTRKAKSRARPRGSVTAPTSIAKIVS